MQHSNKEEVERRTAAAIAAIKRAMDEDGKDSSVALFVSHHLEELDVTYWKEHAGTPRPSTEKVLDLLELRSHWGAAEKDGIDTFDFTLPGNVADYVISVAFDGSGDVESVDMES